MKKLIILLAAVMLLSLTGCEDKKPVEDNKVQEDVQNDIQEDLDDDDADDDDIIEEPVEVDIYVPDDNYMKMEIKEIGIEAKDPQLIINALIDSKVLPEGCEVNFIEMTEDNIQLDLNAVYGDYIRGMGTTGEYFMLGCTVNTFLDIYDKEAIKITIDSETLETGHSVYEGYLTEFNTEP